MSTRLLGPISLPRGCIAPRGPAIAWAAKNRPAAQPQRKSSEPRQREAPPRRFREPVAAPDLPKRRKWLLVLAAVLLTVWLGFLLVIAVSGM